MIDRVVLWENRPVELPVRDADLLELACQRIWKRRAGADPERRHGHYGEIDTNSQQQIISFQRRGRTSVEARPSHYIGSIRTLTRQFIILPKIYEGLNPADIFPFLEFLFEHAYGLRLAPSQAGATGEADLKDLFAEAVFHSFALATLHVLRSHEYMAYEALSEDLAVVRGKIDFQNNVRQNLSMARYDRVACIHEPYRSDTLFTQVLKFVASVVARRTRNDRTRSMLREVLLRLSDVEDRRCTYNETVGIKLTRHQFVFEPVLSYCRLLLAQRVGTARAGTLEVDDYLIDTHALFERFVAGYLSVHSGPNWSVRAKTVGYIAHDMHGELFRFENDAILIDGSGRAVIVDMKYKSVDLLAREKNYGVSQGDIYQMISYAVRRNLRDIILIYPAYFMQDPGYRRFTIDDPASERVISIIACVVPMAPTDPDAIWDLVAAAVDWPHNEASA